MKRALSAIRLYQASKIIKNKINIELREKKVPLSSFFKKYIYNVKERCLYM